MSSYSLDAKSIRTRARAINLPKPVVDEVVSTFLKWCNHSGSEWAVGRLKDIKAAIVYYHASGSLPKGLWVRKVSSNRLAGVWGWLQSHMAESRKGRRRVLQLLNLYTALVAKEMTRKQKKKFFESVTSPRKEVPLHYHEKLREVARRFRLARLGVNRDLLTSPKRRSSHESRLLTEFYHFFGSKAGRDFLIHNPKSVNDILLRTLGNLLGTQRPHLREPDFMPIGEIHVAQEPGYKARFFAAPHLWLQECLEPLKKGLSSLLQSLPWDGTHDQRLGDSEIRRALQEGRMVHCFDLSDATNVFPLELQLTVLREVLPPEAQGFRELFERISSLPWNFQGKPVVWARGQALGLGPSFAMFALTHGLLLLSLAGGDHNDKFFIIGDDVVILDDGLAEAYASALGELDLPYSPTKTLRSNRIAEFAGYVFTPESAFQTVKWKGIRDENLLDVVRVNGPEIISILPESIRDFLTWYGSLPEPLGFGWNPKGLSLDQRFEGLLHLLVEETEPKESYDVDVRRRVISRVASVPSHLQGLLAHRWFKEGAGTQTLRLTEQVDRVFAAAAFKTPSVASWLVQNVPIGRNVRLAETVRDIGFTNLPMEQPERFEVKRKLPRFKQVYRQYKPYYEAYLARQSSATDGPGHS